MRIWVVLVALAGVVYAEDPSKVLAPLIGGSWRIDGELPGGRKVQSRLIVEPFVHGSVRMSSYIITSHGESLMYMTYVYWHPGEKAIHYLTSTGPSVVRGKATAKPNHIRFEQEAQGRYPPMRVEYTFNPENKDAYIGRTQVFMNGEWRGNPTVAKRTQERPSKIIGLRVKDLRMSKLGQRLSGRWDVTGGRRDVSEWIWRGRVFETRATHEGEPVFSALHFADGEKVGILILGKAYVSIGTLEMEGARWTYEWTMHSAAATKRMREEMHFKDRDTHTWIAYAQEDGKWVPVTEEMTNKRIRDAAPR